MSRAYTTDRDIRAMVIETLEAGEGIEDFDIDAIVDSIKAAATYHGREFENVAEGDDFWAIVAQHDTSDQDDENDDAADADEPDTTNTTRVSKIVSYSSQDAATQSAANMARRAVKAGSIRKFGVMFSNADGYMVVVPDSTGPLESTPENTTWITAI